MGIPIYPSHLDHPHLRPFYEGLEQGELRITVDPDTQQWLWYPPEVLPGKPGRHPEWRTVSPNGFAYTFTTVIRSLLPGDHKSEVPFTVVLFESDDTPNVRVPGLLVNAEGREPVCGMRLKLSPVRAGEHIVAGFEPAD